MREFARSHVCACECVGVFSYVWMKMSASAKAVKFLPVVGLVDRFALVRPSENSWCYFYEEKNHF